MNIGRRGEEFVTKIAAQTLFLDFTYERPYFYQDDGTSREVCDLLAVLDAHALPIQIKTQSRMGNRSKSTESRWFEKQIKKASRQLVGSLRTLVRKDIYGLNRIRNEVRFPAGAIFGQHGIAIFDVTESVYAVPSNMPSHSKSGVPLHYFSFTDFLNLLGHLRTFPDLLHYLGQHARLGAPTRPPVNGEKDVYAYYITHERLLSSVSRRSDFQGWWDSLTGMHKASFDLKLDADKYASFVDQMIAEAHDIDPDLDQYTPPELIRSEQEQRRAYFEIASELNRLSLMERREIGQRIFDKARLAADGDAPRYFVMRSADKRMALAFLVSHLPREEWSRRLMIVLQAGMAKLGVRRGIGIALNDMSLDGHAFNFVLLDNLDTSGPVFQELADTFLGEIKPVDWYDFPDQRPNTSA